MRVWLNPIKMNTYEVSAEDVVQSLKEQNVEAAPGKEGESSGKKEQSLQYVIKYSGKYNSKEQYENVVIKRNADGQILHLKDIAEIEFGSLDYDVLSKENGNPSAAIFLVAFIVFIFLGDFRSTLIPAITVPVSLIGTFFFIQLFGFSINMITLFALVLAIGIVVDDAIVVVEAVHAKMEEHHLEAKPATELAIKKSGGAIIAIT